MICRHGDKQPSVVACSVFALDCKLWVLVGQSENVYVCISVNRVVTWVYQTLSICVGTALPLPLVMINNFAAAVFKARSYEGTGVRVRTFYNVPFSGCYSNNAAWMVAIGDSAQVCFARG